MLSGNGLKCTNLCVSPSGREPVSKTGRGGFDSHHAHQIYMNEKINEVFTGTIDQFLTHCSTLEFDISDEEIKAREYERAIAYIMKTENVSREEAIETYKMIAMAEVEETVNKLIADGLLEISGYGEDGEPKYELTSLGSMCAKEIQSDEVAKNSKTKKKKK